MNLTVRFFVGVECFTCTSNVNNCKDYFGVGVFVTNKQAAFQYFSANLVFR